MDWQQTVSLIIVAGATGALLWSRFGRRKVSFDCGANCGCNGDVQSTRNPIVFRARKGTPSQVVVRMK